MSRVVVTGAAGFIGSHVVENFARDDWDVQAIDSLQGGTRLDQLDKWWRGLGVKFTPERMVAVTPDPCDVIVHLASPVGPVGVIDRAGMIVNDIWRDAYTAANWALQNDALLVFVSTSELYGPQDGPSDETATPRFVVEPSARQEYAVGKLAAEIALLNTPGLRVRIIRPFNIAGPRQRAGGGFVIPRWIEQWRGLSPITVYGTGEQRRAFCHVADFVDGLERVVEIGRDGERYNLGNAANACTLNELADLFSELTGAQVRHVDPVALHGPAFREAPDKTPIADKATATLNWRPTRTNRDIIADAIAAA